MSTPPPKLLAGVSPFEADAVRGFLHEASGKRRGALALTHGAGGDCRSPLLVKAATALSAAGISVLRFDLPFRQRRPKGPPSPSTADADRAGLRSAAAALRRIAPGPVYIGGQSYGGGGGAEPVGGGTGGGGA